MDDTSTIGLIFCSNSPTFVLKHKAGSDNRVADAPRRMVLLLNALSVDLTCFGNPKESNRADPDFGRTYQAPAE